MQPDPSVRKVLIYRLGSLGDTVVALPCFHLIARAFPNAERVMLTNFPVHAKAPAAASVLGDSGLVHSYMRYSVGTRNIFELVRLAWHIRSFARKCTGPSTPVWPCEECAPRPAILCWVELAGDRSARSAELKLGSHSTGDSPIGRNRDEISVASTSIAWRVRLLT